MIKKSFNNYHKNLLFKYNGEVYCLNTNSRIHFKANARKSEIILVLNNLHTKYHAQATKYR